MARRAIQRGKEAWRETVSANTIGTGMGKLGDRKEEAREETKERIETSEE